jgi:hypothetical protein
MRVLIVTVIVLLVASTCGAQAPASNLPPPDSQTQTETPAQPPASAMQMIVVPEGTRIPATLTSPISNKAARPGTPVRAVTSFPVTVGGVVAIPVGTYLEGAIDKVTRNRRTGDTMRVTSIPRGPSHSQARTNRTWCSPRNSRSRLHCRIQDQARARQLESALASPRPASSRSLSWRTTGAAEMASCLILAGSSRWCCKLHCR